MISLKSYHRVVIEARGYRDRHPDMHFSESNMDY